MSESNSTTPVEFRMIPGFDDYCIGSDRTVMTTWPRNRWKRIESEWRKVEPFAQSRTGRPVVRLRKRDDKTKYEFTVEHLYSAVFGTATDPAEVNIPVPQAAWAAGFFDGEGCVSIQCKKKPANKSSWFVLSVSVHNTHLGSLERLKEMFGFGTLYTNPAIEGRRQGYRWILSGGIGERFLRTIQPYSVVKAEQIRLALEFRKLGQKQPFRKVSEDIYRRGCEIAEQIRQLNGASYRKAKAKIVPRDYIEV